MVYCIGKRVFSGLHKCILFHLSVKFFFYSKPGALISFSIQYYFWLVNIHLFDCGDSTIKTQEYLAQSPLMQMIVVQLYDTLYEHTISVSFTYCLKSCSVP